MSVMSKLVARLAKLPPPSVAEIATERDLRIPMPDGITLLADRYAPAADRNAPIVLIRSPYGRRQMGLFGEIFAERGYQAVIQSVRGTFGSGGVFDAFRNEERDGHATLDWLAAQPWFNDNVAMYGPSYLGLTQWSVATDAPPFLKALAIQISTANFRPFMYPGEAFASDSALSWISTVEHQEDPPWHVLLRMLAGQRRALEPVLAHLPLATADQKAVGHPVGFYQDWLQHNEPGDEFWALLDFRSRIGPRMPAIHLTAGWYDIFLPDQLDDYAALRAAGHQPYLTIGPWIHSSIGGQLSGLREALDWFDAHLHGDASHLPRNPVRVFVMGSKRWREFADWPPPAQPTRWHLHAHGRLAARPPVETPPDRYIYNSADPTPAAGGIVLGTHAGPRDNRKLEARNDVLTYTSTALEHDLEVIGPVTAELYVRSSLEHTDFFARLCDVAPGGKSINICDGLVRLKPDRLPPDADGILRVEIKLWPTAHCFRAGHCVRVQVSSGAHPRFARNTGSGEALGSAHTLFAANQEVFHDPNHPSAIVLPVF